MAAGRRVVARDDSAVRLIVSADDVGKVLRAERLRRGLSQETLGALIGETRQKVQLIEAGSHGVAVGAVMRALADLGVALIAVPSGRHASSLGADFAADEAQSRLKAEELLGLLEFQARRR
jgi:transcriptional regulator with XRE-family HTH domain